MFLLQFSFFLAIAPVSVIDRVASNVPSVANFTVSAPVSAVARVPFVASVSAVACSLLRILIISELVSG
jgi:hypothetical protein